MREKRFIVSLWHGESGSMAEVRDNSFPDECLGIYSTVRYGAEFRKVAQRHADKLNRGVSTGVL